MQKRNYVRQEYKKKNEKLPQPKGGQVITKRKNEAKRKRSEEEKGVFTR